MNDSSEYARMLEIPLATCEYHYKNTKHRIKKQKLIDSVNGKLAALHKDGKVTDCSACTQSKDNATATQCTALCEQNKNTNSCNDEFCNIQNEEELSCAQTATTKKTRGIAAWFKNPNRNKKHKDIQSATPGTKKHKFDIVAAQVVAIFVLVFAIILTNVFWQNSGMNTLFKSVFSASTQNGDDRNYDQFKLNMPSQAEGLTLVEGIISVHGGRAVYPVCDGKIASVEKTGDAYTITIAHSDNFSSVIKGAQHVYCNAGESVSANLPVCYCAESGEVYLFSGQTMLTDFILTDGGLVWSK